MIGSKRLMLAAALSLAGAARLSANVEIRLTVDLVPAAGDLTPQSPSHQNELMVIGRDYVRIESGEKIVIRDFAKRRIFTVDSKAHTYFDDSMFGDVGFRVAEMANREALSQMLQQMNSDAKTSGQSTASDQASASKSSDGTKALDLCQAESDLSLRSKLTHASAAFRQDDGESTFRCGDDNVVFAASNDGYPADSATVHSFVRGFRAEFGGTPDALDLLEKRETISKQLRVSGLSGQRTIKVLSVRKTADQAYSLAGLTQTVNGDAPFVDVVTRAMHGGPVAMKADGERALADAEKALSEKNYLESMLAYLEYNLEFGGSMPAQFGQHQAELIKDPGVQKLIASLSPRSKEEGEAAEKSLLATQRSMKHRSHVVTIFLADVQSALGKRDEAQLNLQSAVTANPLIAGAWKDLGDSFYAQYDAESAWICWDTGRYLQPHHPLLKEIDDLEASLLREHPEYF